MIRPEWDEYFLNISNEVKNRSTCIRRQVGAVIVKEKRILATGYNGAPSGLIHCMDKGCLRNEMQVPSGQRHEICRAIHAEQNAIIQAAKYGAEINGATIYCTTHPCTICAKMIINAGITKVVYSGEYTDELAIELFEEANIERIHLEDTRTKADGGV